MPTSTLELPREMVDAARRYAASEHRSVSDLIADLLKSRYGFTMNVVVNIPPPQSAVRSAGYGARRISSKVSALKGAFRLPQGVDYDTAKDAVLLEKYGLSK